LNYIIHVYSSKSINWQLIRKLYAIYMKPSIVCDKMMI